MELKRPGLVFQTASSTASGMQAPGPGGYARGMQYIFNSLALQTALSKD